MNIDEAIKQLESEKKGGTKNIIFAWWDASCFERKDDEDWGSLCEVVEDKMDWSRAHEDITETIRYIESFDAN
jgi:hypothetical protein